MKRIVVFISLIALLVAMAIPTYALTPKFKVPEVPQVSKIEFKLDTDFLSDYFARNPLNITFGG